MKKFPETICKITRLKYIQIFSIFYFFSSLTTTTKSWSSSIKMISQPTDGLQPAL